MRGKPKKGYTVTAIRLAALVVCQSCRFLESDSLHPPQTALRRFPCAIEIKLTQQGEKTFGHAENWNGIAVPVLLTGHFLRFSVQ